MLLILSICFTFTTDLILLGLITYYILHLRAQEKRMLKKEHAIDENYHHVVDEALSKERKILDDATDEADQIITDANYLSDSSKKEVNQAVKDLVADISKEADTITKSFTSEYTGSLKQLTLQSLTEFHTVMTGMQTGLKQQITTFHQSMLPQIEQELQTYKQEKMKSIDQTVMSIIQKAAQEIFNKSLSVGDHQSIVTDALEKAKKEGVFD